MIKVLGIGDNVCDKYLHTRTIYPGGNALNIAVFGSMLGAPAAYLGTFGDDEIGKHVYSVVNQLEIDLSHCRFEEGENGCARVLLIDGDRKFLKGNNGGISKTKPPSLTKIDVQYISGYDLIHTSIHSFMEQELPKIRNAAKFISMDFSDRYNDKYLKKCCPYIDCAEISCGNMKEAEIFKTMNQIMEFGCRQMVIATRGSKGALVMADKKLYEQSPCIVKAKDTMGAGDSFIACFLINYLDGIKYSTDFSGETDCKGITTAKDYQNLLIQSSLYRAAVFSSGQCMRDGSFGFGLKIELTEEDMDVMSNVGE